MIDSFVTLINLARLKHRNTYIIDIGDGYKPTAEDIKKYVIDHNGEIDEKLKSRDDFYDMEIEERLFLYFKERAYHIAREYKWKIRGGKLDED